MSERTEIPEYRNTIPLTLQGYVWRRLSLNLREAIQAATYGTVLNFPNGNIFRWIYKQRYGVLENQIRSELRDKTNSVRW